MCTWTDNVKFNVCSYWNDEVRQFNFTVTSFNDLSYEVLSSHILETCYKEKNLVDLYRFRVFYVTFAGDHVEVGDDEILFNAFLRFIRESKARDDECIHLIIADTLNKNGFFREPTTKKLRFRNLDSLFRAKINFHDSCNLDKVAGNRSANIFIRQPPFPPSQKFPSEPGLLCVRRVDGQELSRLLVDGAHVFVASGENNFLSLSFLKEYEAAPYQSMCWQNRVGNFLAPEYQCEEVKIPVVIDDQANINMRNDFKNVIRFCEDNMKKPENVTKKNQAQTLAQTQADAQAQEQAQGQMACTQVEQQQHNMMQHQNFLKKFHGSNRQPIIGNQVSDMENQIIPPSLAQMVTQAQAHAQAMQASMARYQNDLDYFFKGHYRPTQHPKAVNGNQVSNMENQKIPPLQAQAVTQAEVHAQAQKQAQLQAQMKEIHRRLSQQLKTANGNQISDMENQKIPPLQAQAVTHAEVHEQAQKQAQLQAQMKEIHRRLSQQPKTANGNQISDMENFKKDIIAEIKKEIMTDIEKKFSNNIKEKIQIQLGATKNTVKKGEEDFQDIMEQIDEDTVPKNIFRETSDKSMIANEPGLVESKSSNCFPEEYYDSDSSVSLIMDDSEENDRLSDEFDFVEIPRCFVTHENLDEDGSSKVSIRIKHRAPKTPKSTTSETKLSSDFENVSMPSSTSPSPLKADSEIIRERRSHEDASSFPGTHREQEEMKASVATTSRNKNSSDASTKSQNGRETQPVDILLGKVFKMTSNVANSVKIFSHSCAVVPKVLEESLKAGSRLIPNPLIPENLTTSENRAQAAQATNETSSTGASAPNVNTEPNLRPNGNDTFSFDNLPEKIRANLMLLNEMGFCSNAQNLFFLKKYPDDLEKVIESLVNFTVS